MKNFFCLRLLNNMDWGTGGSVRVVVKMFVSFLCEVDSFAAKLRRYEMNSVRCTRRHMHCVRPPWRSG